MPGFVWAVYASDDGHDYLLKVDFDLFAMTERGWDYPVPDSFLPQYPRGWTPRFVTGITLGGSRRYAVCATTSCALWTGAIDTFTFWNTDHAPEAAEVIARSSERLLRPGAAAPVGIPLPPIP